MDATDPLAATQPDAAPPPEPRRGGAGKALVVLVVLVLALATAAPVLDQIWQIALAGLHLAAETPTHDHVWLVLNALPELRIQFAILGVVFWVLAAAVGLRATSLVALFCVVVNLGIIVQSIDPERVRAPAARDADLRLMTFNIDAYNGDRDATVAAIRAAKVDVVVLVEAVTDWQRALEPLRRNYAHVVPSDVRASQGMMIFSRFPILRIQQMQPISEYYPYLVATLQLPSGTVTLLALHPPRPTRIGESIDRAIYFARVADQVRTIAGPVVVAGDMTAVPWSRPLADMMRQTGLTSAWSLKPWLSSWPSWLPYVGLPIDHVLVRGIAVADVRLGNGAGSDHLPVIATLDLDAK